MAQVDFIPIFTALITGAMTILGTLFTVSFRAKNARKRDAEQRQADERDKLKLEMSRLETKKHQWKTAYYILEHRALQQGMTQKELPRTPDSI